MAKRSTFGSKIGTVVVIGGSVVGLGNIWRFPYVAGENGGGAFLLIYIMVSLLISVPIMLSEFSLGRVAKRNSMRAYRKVSGKKAWGSAGYLGIITAFTILSFYSVIAGWSIEMIRQSVIGEFLNSDAVRIKENFDSFVATGWQPAIMTIIFLIMTAVVVSFGIEKGIERFNKIVMPMMVLILFIMVVNSFTLPGFREGVDFILKPDFSKVGFGTVLSALGQSFFSLSLGMGILVTYGSYIKKSENMFRIAGTVAMSDMVIAVLAGLAIFPAVFTFGINPTSGPELVFLTLPNIFAQMTGGQFIAILFFFLLFAAAITSSVSLLEVVVAYVSEELRMSRPKATLCVTLALTVLSMLCIVSQMPDSAVRIWGWNFFDIFDAATSQVLLPIGGILIVLFAGWVMDRKMLRNEMTNGGVYGRRLFPLVYGMVKFVIPIVIAILFLSQLGFIR